MPRGYSMAKRAQATRGTRRRLEAALVGLLAQRPYGSITVADIAAEADVAERTVRRHYASKDDLLYASVLGLAETARQSLVTVERARSPAEGVRQLVNVVFGFCQAHDSVCWAAYSRAVEVPELRDAILGGVSTYGLHIDALVARWPGAWRVEPAAARRALLAVINYPAWWALTWFAGASAPEAAGLASGMLCRYLLKDAD